MLYKESKEYLLDKLKAARARIDAYQQESGRSIRLEIDGGVKVDNIAQIARAGADTFVIGSAVYGAAQADDAHRYDTVIAKLRADGETREIVNLLKQDAALSLRLLRYVNSAAYQPQEPVTSIEHALLMFGRERLYRWLILLACAPDANNGRTSAALEIALVRARMLELLGTEKAPGQSESLFLVGLLSLADIVLQETLDLCWAKLGKRHGSVSVGEFRKQGFLPEALLNYLGLLGSSFADAREVLSQSEMAEAFSLERASKSGAVFDEEKLRWLNALYIRNLTAGDLLERLQPFLREAGYQPETLDPLWLKEIIGIVKEELTTLAEIGDHIDLFFDERYSPSQEARRLLAAPGAREVVGAFGAYLNRAQGDAAEIYAAAIRHAKEKSGARGKDLFMPVRAALTGKIKGPELDKVFVILGKESAVKRLKRAEQEIIKA